MTNTLTAYTSALEAIKQAAQARLAATELSPTSDSVFTQLRFGGDYLIQLAAKAEAATDLLGMIGRVADDERFTVKEKRQLMLRCAHDRIMVAATSSHMGGTDKFGALLQTAYVRELAESTTS